MDAPPSVPKVVAVTGAAGYIGRKVVERLCAEPGVERVIATDIAPPPYELDRVLYLQQSITDPFERIFVEERVEALVHLAFVLRQQRNRALSHTANVGGADNILYAAHAARVKRLVYLSSSTVYGALRDNPEVLAEGDRARPSPAFHYAWDKREAERAFQHYATEHPDAAVSILRSCIVMGPSARNFISQALSRRVLVGAAGDDPPLQFVHEDDLIELLWRFASAPHGGIYNIAGPGTLRWGEVVRMARKRMVRLPGWVVSALTDLAWTLRLQSDAPSAGLDYVRWPWVVSTDKLQRELGFEFRYTSREAMEAWLANRRR